MSYQPGQRIKFAEEKQSYKIVAANERYLICTKPFNLQKTYLYTIVDLEGKRRGPDNMIFGPQYDYNDPRQARQAIRDLMGIKRVIVKCLDISHRRDCELNIEWVK
jgi:hypothetical protein